MNPEKDPKEAEEDAFGPAQASFCFAEASFGRAEDSFTVRKGSGGKKRLPKF